MSAPIELVVEPLTKEEHRALRALREGKADAGQQGLALQVIVNKLSRTHDLPYIPGDPNAGVFLAGRAFVGKQLLKALNLPVE
jgi:hypothetical protein